MSLCISFSLSYFSLILSIEKESPPEVSTRTKQAGTISNFKTAIYGVPTASSANQKCVDQKYIQSLEELRDLMAQLLQYLLY